MLLEDTLFGRVDKVQKAIERLKAFEPPEGYFLAFSGGKDSQCVYHLAKMAEVKFEAHYSVTTVDPKELVRFIKKEYPDVIWDRHYGKDGKPMSMLRLIAEHTIPPTRQNRYCCAELKETQGKGRVVVTGVRWAESARRKNLHGVVNVRTKSKKFIDNALENIPQAKLNDRGGLVFLDDNEETKELVEQCYIKKRTTVNPIIDWLDEDVWEFLNEVVKVPHCCLYDEGFTRIGCCLCPLQGRDGMLRDAERWPEMKNLYIYAFDKMIKNHPGEIKVANGEPAEVGGGGNCSQNSQYYDENGINNSEKLDNMGVLGYTQDGSDGASDGDGNGPDHRRTESDTICSSREREREQNRPATVGTGISGILPMVGQPRIDGGAKYLLWWMWIHRSQSDLYEQSPTGYQPIRK